MNKKIVTMTKTIKEQEEHINDLTGQLRNADFVFGTI